MMRSSKLKHYYLELREGEKVIKRKPTGLSSRIKDSRMMEYFQKEGQEIHFVVSSEKEKIIN